MASGTNNLTLRLSVQDRNFKAGLDRAQKKLIDFQKSVATTFGQRSLGKMNRFAANLDKIAQSVVKLDRALSSMGVTKLDASMKSASNTSRKLSRDINKMSGAADKGAASNNRLGASARRATVSLNTMRKSSARTAEAIRSTALNMQYMIAAMVGGAAAIGTVKFGAQFEKKLGEIDTLLDSNTVNIRQYQEQLIGLSKATPKTLLDLSGALYQIISAGIPAVEGAGGAFDILVKSQKLAVGSISETKQAADLLITTMAAFQNQNVMAAEATDKLTMIYQKGRTTIPQLSKAFGRAAPIAAQFGISLDELGGLMISLTRAGLNTNEAVTGIRALMSGLAKPTKKTQKLLKALGIQFGQAAIESKGFSGVLDEVIASTGGNVDVLAQLFPNIRALLPAVISAGQGFDTFSSHVDMVTNSIGASDLAVQKQSDKFFFASERLKSNFQGVIQDIAQKVLPGLMIGLSRLNRFISENSKEFSAAGVGAMKFFAAVGSIGGSALFKTFEMLLSVVTSLPGKIVLVGAAIIKLGILFTRLFKSSALGLTVARTALNPAMWAAAGTQAGAAGGAAAMTAMSGAVTVGVGGVGARLAAGLSGLARIAGPVGIGLSVGYMLYEGIAQAFGEEEERLNEEALRKEELNLQKAVDRLKKAYREGQGVDISELESIRSKARRGEVFIPEDGNPGDARSVKGEFDQRLRDARASARRSLEETGKDAIEVTNELNKTESERRKAVLKETIEFFQEMIRENSESSKQASERSLKQLRSQLAQSDQTVQHFKDQIASATSEESLSPYISNALTSAAHAGIETLSTFVDQANFFFGQVDTEKAMALASTYSELFNTIKNADAETAKLEKIIRESSSGSKEALAAEISLGLHEQSVKEAREKIEGVKSNLIAALGPLKADARIVALSSGEIDEKLSTVAGTIQHLRNGFLNLKDAASGIDLSNMVTGLEDAANKSRGLRQIVEGISNMSFSGVFSSFTFGGLSGLLKRDVEDAALPENIKKQIDALIAANKALTKVKTTGGSGGSGRRRATANFESLLNRLRKQRIRLEDKLLKIQGKANRLATQRKKIESDINSKIEARKDTGTLTNENRQAFMNSIEIRQEGERENLRSRQEKQLDDLEARQKKAREDNKELIRKNQEDFDKEMKKRLGKHSKNAAKRKAIESEIERIRLATEEKVGAERLSAIREAAKKDVSREWWDGGLDTRGIELTAKEMHETLDKARQRYNKEIVREESKMPGYSSVETAKRDHFKKRFSVGFNEFVDNRQFIEHAKIQKIISDLVEKRSTHVKNEGKLGKANAEEIQQMVEKNRAENEAQMLKFEDEKERAEKSFFNRRSASNKRAFEEQKKLQNQAVEELKRAVSYGDTGLVVDMLFDGADVLSEKGALIAKTFGGFFEAAVEPIDNMLLQFNHEVRQIDERLREIGGSRKRDQKEINKLTDERAKTLEKIERMRASQNFARRAHSALQVKPRDSLGAAIGPLLLNSGAEARSRTLSDQAAAFASENKALIDAANADPEMKRRLERVGISDDASVRDRFSRRSATGSRIDLGAGNEELMQIFGMFEKGSGTNALVDALDFVIPGIGNAVQDSMQELYDSDLHMKMFEDVSAASAEFAQGNVGALFDVATGFAEKVSEKMTSLLSGAARGLGNLIGTSVGNFAGKAFGNTVGPIMQATIGFVADNVLSPIAETLAASFGTMTGGIQSAFSTTADESRLASERRRVSGRARRDLRASTTEISTAARDRTAELDSQIAATSDPQAREELILQRREVIAEMESQLLEARTSFAESERQRLEEHRENNPMLLVDQAFEKAIGLSEKVMFDLPHVAVKVVDGLISNLPTLFTNIAAGLVDTIDSIAEKLPELMMTLVRSLIDVIPKLAESLTTLIPQLVKGLLEALIEILSNLGDIIGPLVEMAVTSIIESFIILVDKIPEIAISLVQGIIQAVSVLAEQAPRIIAALIAAVPSLTIALIGAIPQIVAEIIKSIPTILASFGRGLYRAAIDFGRMIGRAFSKLVSFGLAGDSGNGAVMGTALGAVAGLALAPLTGGASLLGMGAAGAGFGALVGSFFGDGGMVTDSQRNPATASIMKSLGAAQYSTGGMVSSVQRALSSNPLSSMRRGLDDVPAVLQAGEAVLNRRATAVIGEDTINQLNSGVFNGMSGDTQVTLNIEPNSSGIKNAAAALLPLLIGGVNAEVSRPGSKIRNAINSSSGRPVGSMTVPVSKRSIG